MTYNKKTSPLFPLSGRLFLLCAISLFIFNSLYYCQRTCDDAFISFRYAQNMADGNGLVYNVGERVEGYSNFSWVVILAALARLGIAPTTASKILGVMSGIGVIFALVCLSKKLKYTGFPFISIGLLGTNSFFASWAVSGMETVFFTLLLISAVVLVLYESDTHPSLPYSSLLLLLASLTRPEGVLYVAAFLLMFYKLKLPWRYIKRWLALFVFPYAACILLRLAYYGHLLPNTYTAKIGFRTFLFPRGLFLYTTNFLNMYELNNSSFYLLITSGFILFIIFRHTKDFVILSVLCVWCVFCLVTGGDWMPNYRFIVPVFPFIFIAAECGLIRFYRKLTKRGLYTFTVAAWFFLSCFSIFFTDTVRRTHTQPGGTVRKKMYFKKKSAYRNLVYWMYEVPYNPYNGLNTIEWNNVEYILENFYKRDTILFADIGFVGYITGNPIIDMFGLVTPSTANIIKSFLFKNTSEEAEYTELFLREVERKQAGGIFIYMVTNAVKRFDEEVFEKLLRERSFSTRWVLEKSITIVPNKSKLVIYRRKNLERPTKAEVIKRYAELSERFPEFPALKKRLKLLTHDYAK